MNNGDTSSHTGGVCDAEGVEGIKTSKGQRSDATLETRNGENSRGGPARLPSFRCGVWVVRTILNRRCGGHATECRELALEDEDGVGLAVDKVEAAGETARGRWLGRTVEGHGWQPRSSARNGAMSEMKEGRVGAACFPRTSPPSGRTCVVHGAACS